LTVSDRHSILPPIERRAGCHVHRLASIRFGTERYPEQVARRLRSLNLTVWITVALTAGFAIVQFLDPTPACGRSAPSMR
jgi:hypothetical protein